MLELLKVNMKKLRSFRMGRVEQLNRVLKEKEEEFQRIKTEIGKMISEADEIGSKAFNAGMMRPAEIFEQYHSGIRMPVAATKLLQY